MDTVKGFMRTVDDIITMETILSLVVLILVKLANLLNYRRSLRTHEIDLFWKSII